MQRAPTKCVCSRVASNAYQVPRLLDYAHAPRLPRAPELVLAMCKCAQRICTRFTAPVPTQCRFECEALIAYMPLLATSEAYDSRLVLIDICIDRMCIHCNVYFFSQWPLVN